MTKELNRWVPKGYTRVTYKDPVDAVVYVSTNAKGKPCAIYYSGKRTKHDYHYSYRDVEARNKAIVTFFESRIAHNKAVEERKKTRQLTEAAQCAAVIRKELKQRFPLYKFTVTSKNYSMGNSVDINGADIPPSIAEQIESLCGTYSAGSFDGMTDCYEYKKDDSGLPTAKYVHFQNSMSADLKQAIIEYCCKTFGEWENGYNSHLHDHDNTIYRIFRGSFQQPYSAEFWDSRLQGTEKIDHLQNSLVNVLHKISDNLETPECRVSIEQHLKNCLKGES